MQHHCMVCCKIVPDLEMAGEAEWQQQSFTLLRKTFGSYDRVALEMALKFRDTRPESQLSAISVGEESAERLLSTLFPLGFQAVTLLISSSTLAERFSPQRVADQLAHQIRQSSQVDVILLGRMSDDSQNGQTGILLAEQLGWPCIPEVIAFEAIADSPDLHIICQWGGWNFTQRITPPCVLTVGEASGISGLRVATLKEKLAAKGRQVTCLPALPTSQPVTEFRLQYRPSTVQPYWVEAEQKRAILREIYETYFLDGQKS